MDDSTTPLCDVVECENDFALIANVAVQVRWMMGCLSSQRGIILNPEVTLVCCKSDSQRSGEVVVGWSGMSRKRISLNYQPDTLSTQALLPLFSFINRVRCNKHSSPLFSCLDRVKCNDLVSGTEKLGKKSRAVRYNTEGDTDHQNDGNLAPPVTLGSPKLFSFSLDEYD